MTESASGSPDYLRELADCECWSNFGPTDAALCRKALRALADRRRNWLTAGAIVLAAVIPSLFGHLQALGALFAWR